MRKKELLPACAVLPFMIVLMIVAAGYSQSSREPLPVIATIEIPYTFIDQDNKPVNQVTNQVVTEAEQTLSNN